MDIAGCTRVCSRQAKLSPLSGKGQHPLQNINVADLLLLCRTRLGWWSKSEGGGDKTSRWYGPDRAKFLGEPLLLVVFAGERVPWAGTGSGRQTGGSPAGPEKQGFVFKDRLG